MLNFDLQNHRPLREIVYEQLKMQILTGTIVPGTRMMEVELADEMGVSRTPVREAIRKLVKEGLVTIEPGRICLQHFSKRYGRYPGSPGGSGRTGGGDGCRTNDRRTD